VRARRFRLGSPSETVCTLAWSQPMRHGTCPLSIRRRAVGRRGALAAARGCVLQGLATGGKPAPYDARPGAATPERSGPSFVAAGRGRRGRTSGVVGKRPAAAAGGRYIFWHSTIVEEASGLVGGPCGRPWCGPAGLANGRGQARPYDARPGATAPRRARSRRRAAGVAGRGSDLSCHGVKTRAPTAALHGPDRFS